MFKWLIRLHTDVLERRHDGLVGIAKILLSSHRMSLLTLRDVLKHKKTGGTNPKDIHEFLRMMHPQLELGYSLVRKPLP